MQLEYLSVVGFMLVLTLLCTMVVESCSAGLPAIGERQFPIVGFTDLCARSLHLVHLKLSMQQDDLCTWDLQTKTVHPPGQAPIMFKDDAKTWALSIQVLQSPLRPQSAQLLLRSTSTPLPCPCCGRCHLARRAMTFWHGPYGW